MYKPLFNSKLKKMNLFSVAGIETSCDDTGAAVIDQSGKRDNATNSF